MSSVHVETFTETKDTLASNLLFRNPNEGGTLHTIDSQTVSSTSSSPISSDEEQETTTKSSLPTTTSTASMPTSMVSTAAATAIMSTITVTVDTANGYAEVDAAIAVDSVLSVNNVGSWVQGVSCTLYGKVDSVDEGIDIIKSVIETGVTHVSSVATMNQNLFEFHNLDMGSKTTAPGSTIYNYSLPDKLLLIESLIKYLLPLVHQRNDLFFGHKPQLCPAKKFSAFSLELI
ncbi:uncharacterized protein BJ212DRAFT_1296748 [Suillus subaureus]|uniref:Uncharacterized protein n=1 Tax=Suillus subaureus TaxID=48587 RepID=A0A9P7EJ07_9AGAM|nr:uncharacterized protein BJ212DRAFT_1296748 [Suillus subaureus]KAG1822785.1 hypothetical protein BJ212DRAFT_1296748 [Suillus subaureus]